MSVESAIGAFVFFIAAMTVMIVILVVVGSNNEKKRAEDMKSGHNGYNRIAWTEIVDSTHRTSERTKAGSAFVRGAVGGALLGPVGPLAGASSAKKEVSHEDKTTFVIFYENGQRDVKTVDNNSVEYKVFISYVGADKQYFMNRALGQNQEPAKIAPVIHYQKMDKEIAPDESFKEEEHRVSLAAVMACIALFIALPMAGFYIYSTKTEMTVKQGEPQNGASFAYAVTTEVSKPKATPVSTRAGLPTATPAPIRGKITRGVNVRADATADSEKVGSLKQGETVTITKAYYNPKWHQILYEGEIRYISANYCEIKE